MLIDKWGPLPLTEKEPHTYWTHRILDRFIGDVAKHGEATRFQDLYTLLYEYVEDNLEEYIEYV